MKYKVGDKVKVILTDDMEDNWGHYYMDSVGEVCTITRVRAEYYILDGNKYSVNFDEDCLIPDTINWRDILWLTEI